MSRQRYRRPMPYIWVPVLAVVVSATRDCTLWRECRLHPISHLTWPAASPPEFKQSADFMVLLLIILTSSQTGNKDPESKYRLMCTAHYRTSAITITTLCLFLIEGLFDIDIFSWNHLLCRYVELGGMARVNLFSDRSFLKSRHF